MKPRQIKWYGWKRSLPDKRDYLFRPMAQPIPDEFSLVDDCPPVYDQGNLGSCVGNAVAFADQWDRKAQGAIPDYVPSRLMLYYGGRTIENTVREDSGLEIRDGIKALAQWGACPETMWPYNIARFKVRPPKAAYTAGKKNRAIEYGSVGQSEVAIKLALLTRHPIVFGFTVYENFESKQVERTGVVPMPNFDTEGMVGGHAVALVGWQPGVWIVRNSWGPKWGMSGYFTFPLDYVLDHGLASDFWVVRRVGAANFANAMAGEMVNPLVMAA